MLTSADTHGHRTIALDLHDLVEDWAICRGLGLGGLDAAVNVAMQAVRDGAQLGDAFERAKYHMLRS